MISAGAPCDALTAGLASPARCAPVSAQTRMRDTPCRPRLAPTTGHGRVFLRNLAAPEWTKSAPYLAGRQARAARPASRAPEARSARPDPCHVKARQICAVRICPGVPSLVARRLRQCRGVTIDRRAESAMCHGNRTTPRPQDLCHIAFAISASKETGSLPNRSLRVSSCSKYSLRRRVQRPDLRQGPPQRNTCAMACASTGTLCAFSPAMFTRPSPSM